MSESERLQNLYFDALDKAQDEGRVGDAWIQYVGESEIVEFIEIDGVEHYNFDWEDEWEVEREYEKYRWRV